MAHEVNQSETDFAAQVRSALVAKISMERLELWLPDSTEWEVGNGLLTLRFANEFSGQLAKQMLYEELNQALKDIGQGNLQLAFESLTDSPLRQPSKQVEHAESTKGELEATDFSGEQQFVQRADSGGEVSFRPKHQRSSTAVGSTQVEFDGNAAVVLQKNLPSTIVSTKPSQVATTGVGRDNLPEATPTGHQGLVNKATTSPKPNRTGLEHWQQFIPGESNQLAWGAAKLIVDEPGKMTPVFVHGPSGVGKSLLASGVAECLRSVRRLRRVAHMHSEQFLNDFTEGLRGGGLPMFRRKYRDVEALILEDIQFLIGKKSTIVEVKQTLDNLLRLGKQVVFTADRSLNDLPQLGGELLGRIRGGLTVPVFPIDGATRYAILKREIESAGIEIDAEVIEAIAARVTGDGRVLSGIAKRLTAVASLESASSQSRALDWDRCWSTISDLVQATRPIVRIVDIDRVVCDVFGLEPESLKSSSKTRRVSQPRMLAMFLARKYTPSAYKEIGQYFGKRRHSTVISAEKTVSTWLEANSDLDFGSMKIRDAVRHVESQLQVG